jgi:hypothetical protein
MDQYNAMTMCINNEKTRIQQKELELKQKVLNIEKVEIPEEVRKIAQQEEEIVM